jgi:hypothetical protein
MALVIADLKCPTPGYRWFNMVWPRPRGSRNLPRRVDRASFVKRQVKRWKMSRLAISMVRANAINGTLLRG